MRPIQVTVSGSFRQAMGAVQTAVEELTDRGALVLSPADPRVVDQFGDFVFVASDQVRHIRTVQSRHLVSVGASDFLWLVAPDGYVGTSASMEIGFAAAKGIPVFAKEVPLDLTLRQWVEVVPGPGAAIDRIAATRSTDAAPGPCTAAGGILLDPVTAIEQSHDDLLVAERGLLGAPSSSATEAAEAALRRVRSRTLLPS